MLSRVFGIKRDGTVLSAESDTKNHNSMSKDLYGGYISELTNTQREIAEGAVKSHWPIAGAVVKNRKDLIFLEMHGEEIIAPFCITLIPTALSKRQLSIARNRYKSSDLHFIDATNCNGSEFVSHIELEPFDSLYEYLSKQYEKDEIEPDIDML